MGDSYFPIKIVITEKNHPDFGLVKVVDHNELPIGVSMKVLETRAKKGTTNG